MSSQGQLVLFEKYCKPYTKKRRKIETSNYFAKINESNLRLLIYKLRLNNIILQAINYVMSKENRFLQLLIKQKVFDKSK